VKEQIYLIGLHPVLFFNHVSAWPAEKFIKVCVKRCVSVRMGNLHDITISARVNTYS
jgi:hypothetical protein